MKELEKTGHRSIEFERSLSMDVLMFMAACIATVAFGRMALTGQSYHGLPVEVVGLLAGFCAVSAVSAGRRLFGPEPRLIITPEGILDRTALMGGGLFIHWEEIRSVWRGSYGRVCIDLAHPERVERRASSARWIVMRLQRALGRPSINIHTIAVDTDADEVLTRLSHHLGDSRIEPRRRALLDKTAHAE